MALPKTFVEGFHNEECVRKMEYLNFGKTGLKLSKVSIGGATFANFYGTWSEDEAIQTIIEAFRRGINYIDTAPYYGQGKSESVIGKALIQAPRSAFYIATKVGRYNLPGTYDQFDYSAKRTRESVERSLKLLGVDYIDLIQIHDIEFEEDLNPVINECLPTLEALRDEGKVKFIGVTCYPLTRLKEAITLAPKRFDSILGYARHTLIDNSFEKFLDFFQKENVGMVCAAGHAMKLLTNTGPEPWHPGSDEIKAICSEARNLCKARGVDLGKLAMYHFLQLKGPATFLVGMETRALLEVNLRALYEGLTDKEEMLLQELRVNVFSKLKTGHWEGVEIAAYREFIKTKPN